MRWEDDNEWYGCTDLDVGRSDRKVLFRYSPEETGKRPQKCQSRYPVTQPAQFRIILLRNLDVGR